jgi:hypothetical protein
VLSVELSLGSVIKETVHYFCVKQDPYKSSERFSYYKEKLCALSKYRYITRQVHT